MKNILRILLSTASFLLLPVAAKAAPMRYVQISTNAVTLQTGTYNVSGGTMTAVWVSTFVANNSPMQVQDSSRVVQASVTTGGFFIKGTNTNDSASTGWVGEFVSSAIPTYTAFPTSTNYGDLAQVSLTAGDWDLTGCFNENPAGATVTNVDIGISATSGNSTSGLTLGDNFFSITTSGSNFVALCVPAFRVSISATTTYYLKYEATYTVATPLARARLSARRRR